MNSFGRFDYLINSEGEKNMKKMLKKLSSVLLAVAMLVTMMPAVVGASGGLSYEKTRCFILAQKINMRQPGEISM